MKPANQPRTPGPAAAAPDSWRRHEETRRRRLREDGRRPLAVNLAEGLALSEFLSTFTGSARRDRAVDRADLEALEAAQERDRDEG